MHKHKKGNFSTLIWVLFYLFIFFLLLDNSLCGLDPDLGWHLKVGEQIMREGAVPNFENYDYTLAGRTWVDHEWLLNLFSFGIYRDLGYTALNIIFALLVVIILIILAIFTKKLFLDNISLNNAGQEKGQINGNALIMIFQFFGITAIAPHLGVRMQEITLLNLLLLIIILEQFSRSKNYKILFWLFPLFCFWANVHAGFLIGLFLLFSFAFIKIIETVLKKRKFLALVSFSYPLPNKAILLFAGFIFFAILATFFTPYGLNLYSFLNGYTNTFYMKKIAEWLPIYYPPILYKRVFYSAIISSAFLLYICSIYKKIKNKLPTEINLWHMFLVIVFLFLSFKSKRHFPLFFIASFPFFVQLTKAYLIYPAKFLKIFEKGLIIKSYLVMGFLLATASFLIKIDVVPNPFSSPKFCQKYPCAAINFLKSNPQYTDYKIFTAYDWGGFMIWEYPEKKLFIDGRLPFYQYNNHSLLEEYLEFSAEEKVENKLNEHQIQLVLLKLNKPIKLNWLEKRILLINEEKINSQKNYLQEYLSTAAKWKLVYNDDLSHIYIRD